MPGTVNKKPMSTAEANEFLTRPRPNLYANDTVDVLISMMPAEEQRCIRDLLRARDARLVWLRRKFSTLFHVRPWVSDQWGFRHIQPAHVTREKLDELNKLIARARRGKQQKQRATLPPVPPLLPHDQFTLLRNQIKEIEREMMACESLMASPDALRHMANKIEQDVFESELRQHERHPDYYPKPNTTKQQLIAKLRAMARDPAVTPAEAAAFAAKAAELERR